ncbi:MAG: shikimate dehydrogenase [Rhodospirillaceae bacterium]|nr:shikimate dehydrogenase [Rhodospirillaceae bacterium]HAA92347.1 shikimate dehydrogenase [Rhodospirillaceae bacterium]
MTLSGETRLAGIMGWPVSHSKSPRLHGFWLEELGIDGAYLPLEVAPENLAQAVAGLIALGFQGANLTIPHKEAVIPLCDSLDDTARRIGAVNMITVGEDSSLNGSNSDAFGFIENLRQNSDWSAADGPAVILGAGGAARAVAVALSDSGVPEIRIVNRTVARAETLIESANIENARTESWDSRNDALEDAALLVNTTSLGMTGHEALEIDLSALPSRAVVNDIVYAPLQTDLLVAAAANGNPAVDGLGMLLHQAVPGFETWFGTRPEVSEQQRSFVLA